MSVVVIGAGPAGLTAGFFLTQAGVKVTVVEADPEYVGGISRTVQAEGFHFDIGGHRFFSKSQKVEDFWSALLPNDLLERPRSSKIFYRKKFFSYPLSPLEAFWKLGVKDSFICFLSLIKARVAPIRPVKSFGDWVTNRFGKKLFEIFFKTYTEKVWGMSCQEISADWAAQRISNLSIGSAIWHAIFRSQSQVKSLATHFRYPRKGPGMLWEACADRIREQGGEILLGHKALSFHYENQKWKVVCEVGSQQVEVTASELISSAAIRDLIPKIYPALPKEVIHAATQLRYRDFITVVLVFRGADLFSENWIYIHDPSVKVGRIQNFKSWSPEMVPDPAYGCYGLEYFCFEGDGLWQSSNENLIQLASEEIEQIGLAKRSEVEKGFVIRQSKAYPVYDREYQTHIQTIRKGLENLPHLHLVGRNGMHKYNNQDHAVMTAMLTVENLLNEKETSPRYDVWRINQDAEYCEGGNAVQNEFGLRQTPTSLS